MVSVHHENRGHSKPGHTSIHISPYIGGKKYTGTFKLDIPLKPLTSEFGHTSLHMSHYVGGHKYKHYLKNMQIT
jgi:hypothetical protein